MDDFNLAQSFVEYCVRGEAPEKLKAAFEPTIAQLGFGYYALCSHTNPVNPPPGAVIHYNYPTVWVRTFGEAQLHTIDPVLQYAESSRVPFFWNGPEFRRGLTVPQKRILAAASSVGLVGGWSVPIRLSWWPGTLRASCSLVPDAGSLDPRNYEIAEQLATVCYAAAIYHQMPVLANAAAPVRLAPRERRCLELAVRGSTDWEISQILKISESTVSTYIKERAAARIGASTRAQVVAYAFMTGQVSFGDVRARSGEWECTRRRGGLAQCGRHGGRLP